MIHTLSTLKYHTPILIKCLLIVSFLFYAEGSAISASNRGLQLRIKEQAINVGWQNYNPQSFHALVIGISDYKEWPSLKTPENDAKQVATVLEEVYGFGEVKILLNEQASKANIIRELLNYRKRLTAKDSLLIYYAGHGQKDEDADIGYWVPYDGKRNLDYVDTYIPNSTLVNDYFRTFKGRHLLVVSDSCFSGLLRGGETPPMIESYQQRFEKSSRHILTSGAIEPVPDNAGNGHSPFATRFLQYLNIVGKPVFSTYDLYSYIRENLTMTSPLVASIDSAMHIPGGEFVFIRERREGDLAVIEPPSVGVSQENRVIPPRDTSTLPDTVGFVFSQPVEGILTINGHSYRLAEEQMVTLPAGTYPFVLDLGEKKRPIYGRLEVLTVDKNSREVTFGVGENVLFKESHLRAALAGSPVHFNLGIQQKIVARYQLSLRKI